MRTEIENKLIKEKIVHYRLENGLNIYVLPKKGYNKQFAVYATKYGSIDTEFILPGKKETVTVPAGVAHFLEHQLFEDKQGNVLEVYSRLGAEPNAFTNFTTTAYYFISAGNFYRCLDILISFVNNPYFTDESVEKEKGIIAQEIKMYEDSPGWRLFFNFLGGLYHKHPVKNDIAGTVESIQRIDKEILYLCHRVFYHPSNMILFAAGDIEPDQVFERVGGYFKDKPSDKQEEIKRIYPEEPADVAKKEIEEKMVVSRPMFALGFKDIYVGDGGRGLLEKIIKNKILLDMLVGPSSNFYNQMYEEGLIDDSFQAGYTGEINYGYVAFEGESPNPKKVAEMICEEIEKRKSQPWDENYFMRIKRKKTGEFIRTFNSMESISNNFVSLSFRGINLFDYLEVLKKIDYADIIDHLKKFFNLEYRTLSIVFPDF